MLPLRRHQNTPRENTAGAGWGRPGLRRSLTAALTHRDQSTVPAALAEPNGSTPDSPCACPMQCAGAQGEGRQPADGAVQDSSSEATAGGTTIQSTAVHRRKSSSDALLQKHHRGDRSRVFGPACATHLCSDSWVQVLS